MGSQSNLRRHPRFMEDDQVYGAFASIRIRYDGDLTQLAEIIADKLEVKSVEVSVDEWPPHEDVGTASTLGWDLWLTQDFEAENKSFILEICTTDSAVEIMHHKMHDLSPWFARYVSMVCKLNAVPIKKRRSSSE